MCSIFILLIYYIFILFTNNHLGEGIEKVVKISQDKIDDMIKQIMTFKSLYRKKLSKLYQIEQDNKKKKEEEIGKTVIFKNEDKLVVKNKSNNLLSNDYSFDVKKHKKLKIFKELVYHYTITILIIIGFSIPLYLMLPHTINNACGLMYSHTYLLENFL